MVSRVSKIQGNLGEGGTGQILVEFINHTNKICFSLRVMGRYQLVLSKVVT